VVENKGGAGGNIAALSVAQAEPDGYTMFIPSLGHAINRFIYPSLGYDSARDFSSVSLICVFPNVMTVPLSSPAHTVAEFIAHAKANKGKVTYASSGAGSSLHLSGELFKRLAGVELTHVPYRGSSGAMTDLIAGRVDVLFANTGSMIPLIHAGRVRGLGVTSLKRTPAAPELPPVADTVPGYDVSSWYAFFVPARTPAEIVGKMQTDTVKALGTPEVKEKFEQIGAVAVGSTPAELATFLKAEMDKWGPVIKAAHISAG
jgi:tripartite-type tricarboxylate transporter receptor subunit TctC